MSKYKPTDLARVDALLDQVEKAYTSFREKFLAATKVQRDEAKELLGKNQNRDCGGDDSYVGSEDIWIEHRDKLAKFNGVKP
jgi:hypothetical protein